MVILCVCEAQVLCPKGAKTQASQGPRERNTSFTLSEITSPDLEEYQKSNIGCKNADFCAPRKIGDTLSVHTGLLATLPL